MVRNVSNCLIMNNRLREEYEMSTSHLGQLLFAVAVCGSGILVAESPYSCVAL